ncbi:anhydro-N-acetylmuramic acid kinase [Aerophototrophica crusticola]|uniref:Anhydro-N-acetylmuramic acid kinase n=1 Tax=Aerophototrophica crusticola TaxID=1709002 RepID=A0A858R7K2_9PROT|nr:anhydro-N-acetylmuramic acid kinase [Rhodospirillaceae bacterium B3]
MPDTTLAIGLMSGTSLDGIDAALLRTDGRGVAEAGAFLTVPYRRAFRDRLRAVLGGQGDVAGVERELTELHAAAVDSLLGMAGVEREEVGLVGFHGHTILHAPEQRRTWQIGDGALLATLTGIPVVNDFRSADVAAGGQGAPLVPLYHQALATDLDRPLAVLNIGGVANVTWLGAGELDVAAFDTGPGNALVDDWVLRHTGDPFDDGGRIAAKGTVDEGILAALLAHPYFTAPFPKSLDRDAWSADAVAGLSLEDGAATLTAFTAASIAAAAEHLPSRPARWLVTGGGRRNDTLMWMLARRLRAPVSPVDAVGWNGDSLEAEAFAYLAVRSRLGLPLSVPGTTGVPQPMTGGRYWAA